MTTLRDYDIENKHRVTFDVVFTLKQSLSHIGKSVGNVSNLHTIGVRDMEGRPCETFIYSGNAIRNGIIRRVGIMGTLDALDLNVPPDIHQMLFSGGRIDGGTVKDLTVEARMRRLFPALSVLGTAKPSGTLGVAKSLMLDGRIKIGHGWLICYEAANRIPRRLLPVECSEALAAIEASDDEFEAARCQDGITDLWTDGDDKQKAKLKRLRDSIRERNSQHIALLRSMLKSWHELTTTDTKYRRDSLHDTELARRVVAGTGKQLKEAKQAALPGMIEEEKSDEPKTKEKSDQMIIADRLIRTGNRLWSRWDFNGTDVEEGFLYSALREFAKSPYLGGKGAAGGNGLVDVKILYRTAEGESGHLLSFGENALTASARVEEKEAEYNRYVEQLKEYTGYLADNKSAIAGFLA